MSDNNNVSTKKQDINDDNQQEKLVPELRFPEFKDNWKLIRLKNLINNESSKLSINNLEDNYGNYPLYGASGFIKNINFYKKEENYIAIVKDGSGVGNSFIYNGKSSVVGTMQYLNTINNNDLKFAYYLLQTLNLEKYKIGSSIPHIYFKDYSKEKIYLPSINEQKEISNFLSLIDKKIELLEKKLCLIKNFKMNIAYKLFNSIRSEPYKKVFDIFKTCPQKPYEVKKNEIYTNGKYIVIDQGSDKIAGYSNQKDKLFKNVPIICFGDHTTNIKYVDKEFIIGGDGLKLLKPKKNYDIKFLYYSLKFNNVHQEGYKRHYSILKEVDLNIPNFSKQKLIAQILTIFDNYYIINCEKLEYLKKFKKGLLQKMFV